MGKVAVKTGAVTVKDAPKGRGPYDICATPKGDVWYCSLAGSFIARIDLRAGANIRQIHGRPGEVWLPESGTEHISVIRNA